MLHAVLALSASCCGEAALAELVCCFAVATSALYLLTHFTRDFADMLHAVLTLCSLCCAELVLTLPYACSVLGRRLGAIVLAAPCAVPSLDINGCTPTLCRLFALLASSPCAVPCL